MIPPSQGDAKLAAVTKTAWFARLGLAVLLAVLVLAAPPGRWRWGVLLVGAWTLLRAPVGPAALFSPATFYRPVMGIGTSAGSLLAGAPARCRRLPCHRGCVRIPRACRSSVRANEAEVRVADSARCPRRCS